MTTPLAVVTGAASGIGLALTLELVARSVEVIAIDQNPMPFQTRPNITAIELDVSDADAMQQLADTFSHRPLNYLFSNAGIGASGSVFGASGQDWQRVWNVNTMGALHCLRSWWPHLVSASGKAVVTVSAAALLTYPGAALYRASKAALLSMLESLYYETRDSGVTLHALCPGLVQTNILNNALPDGVRAPADPLTAYLLEAMRHAESAPSFARRVLDGLRDSPPFYWFTHPDTVEAMDTRHHAVTMEGHPPMNFGKMP